MKINLYRSNQDKKIGGGWSFLRNFENGLKKNGHEVDENKYDLSMVCGATMVTWDQWNASKKKPRVLRADGVPEDFRNRGTGWSRFKGYADQANLIIFQSEFSKNTVGRLVKKTGPVIINGVDTLVFNKTGNKEKKFGEPSLVFIHYRDDPNKRFQEVIEKFRQYKIDNPKAAITFIGDYPKNQIFWNGKTYDFGMLDLKQNVDWRYLGIISDRNKLASILRSSDFIAYPSFADPCPNTLIEALACGCKPIWINSYGSSNEIINMFNSGYDFSLSNMANKYLEVLKDLK